MITEEQLKNVLDSLRTNVYDTPTYNIRVYNKRDSNNIIIRNEETKTSLEIWIYTNKIHYWPFGIHFITKLKKPSARIYKYSELYSDRNEIEISKELAYSFISYITERSEQDKLICETNVNREFNL